MRVIRGSGRLVWLALLAVLAAPGCGPTPPKLVPVRGKVIYRGRPVPFTSLQFNPVNLDDKGAVIANATTEGDGSYKLKSYPHGEGAKPGRYRVILTPYPGSGLNIPEKYRDPEGTPLVVEIPEQGKDNLDLVVTD